MLISAALFSGLFTVTSLAASKKMPEKVTVVYRKNCKETEDYAAKTLAKYFEKATGVKCVLADDTTETDGFIISVGNTKYAKTDVSKLADGSYRIKRYGDVIEINGAGTRGTIYGVYGFLEKVLGCKIFTSDEGVVCTKTDFNIPQDLNIEYEPYFEYTDTDWRSPRDVEYSLMNGLSGGVYRTISAQQGGTVSYLGSFCHTLTNSFCSEEKYFAEHPEYFALRNGERNPNQLCLTNEDVYKTVLNEVFELLKEQHDPNAALQIISLTQDDNEDFCECENCKALDDANGSHAGTMITFVNRIAKEVKKAGYDNVAIDTFAYRYTRTTPTNVVPEKNVIVRLCTIECCFSHALDDENCEENKTLMQDLINWNKICNRLYIWDYTTNYAYTLGIFPDFGVISKNARIFYEHGVKGIYEEGNYYIDECDTEFGELRAYLLSKVLQDPYCDYSEEMNLFLKDYYGAGWENIRRFIDITTENAGKNHLGIYYKMSESLSLNDDEISECDKLWENAKTLCENENQLSHINRSELCWRYWKASVNKGEFSKFFAVKEKKELVNDIKNAGTLKHQEGSNEINPSPLFWLDTADNWFSGAKGAVKPIYWAAWAVFALTLVFALIIFIKAIKLKKYLLLVPFPLLSACTEIFMWNRRAYLAWRDLGEYYFTTVFIVLIFAFMYFIASKIQNKSKLKCLIQTVIGALAFIVPYEFALTLINNIIYHYHGNNLAFSVASLLCSITLLIPIVIINKNLKSKNK